MNSRQGARKRITPGQANRLTGHPVCVVLHDGSYYVGWMQGIKKGEVLLSGVKGKGKMKSSAVSKGKVRTSGLWQTLLGGGGLGSLPGMNAGGFGNPLAAGALGGGLASPGGGGFFGMMQQWWPTISFGFQMVKTIIPLIGAFKI